MQIFGWVSDYQGCGYYRLGLPLQELRDTYPDMVTSAHMSMPLEEADTADLIIAQRLYKMDCTSWLRRQPRERIVYEIDDDMWHLNDIHPNRAEFDRPIVRNGMTGNVAHAGLVTVSTEALADVIRPINPNVRVLPNCIDAALLEHDRPKRDRLVVGWAGSQTHRRDFEVIAQPLRQYLGKNPQVEMHFIGTDYSALIRRTSRITPWTPGVEQYQRTIDFDIGLAPLTSEVFNQSKSPVKALEYGALGIPTIASDVGPYADYVQHGVTGFLCRTEYDWLRALRALTEDADMRESMGKAAREQAAGHTIQKNAWRWRDVYEKALAGV